MPHCVLEYTSNVIDKIDSHQVLREINSALADTGLFKLTDIKSRIIVHEHYCIGDDVNGSGFASLSIAIFPGRDAETRLMLCKKCLELLKPYFRKSLENLKFDITVRIDFLDKESYVKMDNSMNRTG